MIGQRIRIKPGLNDHAYPDPKDQLNMLYLPVSGRTGVVVAPKEKFPGVLDPGIWMVRLDVIDDSPDWAKTEGWLNTSFHEMWLEPEGATPHVCICSLMDLMAVGCRCGHLRKETS
jgi:hypothetical protein